jgi:hypothetical protein
VVCSVSTVLRAERGGSLPNPSAQSSTALYEIVFSIATAVPRPGVCREGAKLLTPAEVVALLASVKRTRMRVNSLSKNQR